MRHRGFYLLAVAGMAVLLLGCQGAAPAPAATTAPAPPKPAEQKAAAPASTGSKYPDKPMAMDLTGQPGGGMDVVARSAVEVLRSEGLCTAPMTVTNHAGGGGNQGMAFLAERPNDAYLLMMNTNRVFLNALMGTTKLTPEDFTPVATLMGDYMVLAVGKDSPYKTAKDLMDALKKDPKAVSIGVGSAPPSNDHLNIVYAASAAGVDPGKLTAVSLSGGGELNARLLGGHVGAVSTTLGEAMPYYRSGDFRLLAITSTKRVDDAPDVPTWREQGYDVEINFWRAWFGAKNMPKEALDYWMDTLGKMVKTQAWKTIAKKNGWQEVFLGGEELRQALRKEAKQAEDALRPLGVLKK